MKLYRQVRRAEALEQENLRHAKRELSLYQDDDGFWVLRGRFTPEQGALISKALDAASDRYLINIHTEVDTLKADGDGAESEIEDRGQIPEETSRRMACDCSVVHWQEDEEGFGVGRKWTMTWPFWV